MTQAAGPDQPWADADTNRSRNCTLAGASGVRRAAALLVALRLDLSSEIVPHLPHDDVGRLTWELSSIVELRGRRLTSPGPIGPHEDVSATSWRRPLH